MSHNAKGHRRVSPGRQGAAPGPTTRLPAKKRTGIRRAPRDRTASRTPLTEAQIAVYSLLTEQPQSAGVFALALGRSRSSVDASLYCLADRDLAVRVPGVGWRLA